MPIPLGESTSHCTQEVICVQQLLPALKTLLIASAGGFIGHKLRIPSGALIGSTIAVGASSLAGFNIGHLPAYTKPVAQVLVGAVIGIGMKSLSLSQAKAMLVSAAVITVTLLGSALVAGYAIHRFFGVDLAVALFSAMPGGMTEMTLAASDYNMDVSLVAFIHLFRLVGVITVGIPIVKVLLK